MAIKQYQKRKKITLAQQKLAIRRKYSNSVSDCRIEKGTLRCVLSIRPTDDSREYDISLEYKMRTSPGVYLINQGLMNNKKDALPHCYKCNYLSPNEEHIKLCLFYPGREEWNGFMFLSDTIIPWAVEWLYYYEQWRMTGEWYGGGEHPRKKK